MDNRIVIEPAAKIREMARQALAGNWNKMIIGMLIYFVFDSVIGSLLDCFFYSSKTVELFEGYSIPVNISYASGIYEFFVAGALMCGMLMFLLAFFRTRTIDYALTFEGFSMFGKAFVLYLLYSIKIALWALLFFVPGIIASYRYSQCFYLRVDNPDWTASQCIKESSRLMKGNKAKLFGLELSFIGWILLAAIPTVIVDIMQLESYAYVIASAILSVPAVYVGLYSNVSATIFYELLNGNLVVVREGYGESNPYRDNLNGDDMNSKDNMSDRF